MSQGAPGYDWDLEVDDGGGFVKVETLSCSVDFSFDSADTQETNESAESNTLTTQRATVSGECVMPSAALSGGKQDIVEAFFAKTEMNTRVTPAGDSSGNNQYTFNTRCHDLSFGNGGPAGAASFSFTLRLSDGTVVSTGTA